MWPALQWLTPIVYLYYSIPPRCLLSPLENCAALSLAALSASAASLSPLLNI